MYITLGNTQSIVGVTKVQFREVFDASEFGDEGERIAILDGETI